MNVVVEKAQSFLRRNKVEVDPVMEANLLEREEVENEIRLQAAKVVRLQMRAKSHAEVDPAAFNETQSKVAGMELDAAERVFFTLFNRLRVLYGMNPLEGVKFTGDYNYESHVGVSR